MLSTRSYALLFAVAVAATISLGGCPKPTPTPSVLEGTWTLNTATSPNPSLTQVLLTFDSSGNLTTIAYVFDNATVTSTKPELTSTTTVTGSDVVITSTFGPSGNSTLTFNGTLNADDTVITGTTAFTIVVNSTTTIAFPTGDATLTKGTTPVGNATAGQTLFNSDCVSCHNGTIAPAAANLDASRIVSNLGTIDSAMKDVPALTNQQILDLQAYLATLTPAPVGDATAGETFFNATCVGCHTAGSLKEASSEIVSDLGTIGTAMSGITLTDQEIANLQAYLATVTGPSAGVAADGDTFFTATCAGCHPTASTLTAASDNIITNLGAVNSAMNTVPALTDQQIVDLQAFLATQ